jgi:hypothetical protein
MFVSRELLDNKLIKVIDHKKIKQINYKDYLFILLIALHL